MLSTYGSPISISQAKFVAKFGKILSPLELDFLGFYLAIAMKRSSKPTAPSSEKYSADHMDQVIQVFEKHICDIFLRAVRAHDGNQIKQIAKAVWYFEKKIEDKSKIKADKYRFALLSLRQLIDHTGMPMDIHTAVSFVEFLSGEKIQGEEHSYPDFRKDCKELGIKLKPREIREK